MAVLFSVPRPCLPLLGSNANGVEGFDPDKALSKDNLQDCMIMLSFSKLAKGGTLSDTRIRSLGLKYSPVKSK